MSDILDGFIDKKKADSPFISLLDGESVVVKRLKNMKMITKQGFSGDEIEVLRLYCIVDTEFGEKEKSFDNSTKRFAEEIKKKGVEIGSGFTLTREGEKFDTRYEITDVVAGSDYPA